MSEEKTEKVLSKSVRLDLELNPQTEQQTIPDNFKTIFWLAKVVDAWRIFPRLFISAYIYVFYEYAMWMMALENPTTRQASLFSVITGIGAAWFAAYVATGKKD